MLDTTLFSVSFPSIATPNRSLILSGCRVVLPEEQAYSELDELNYYSLNNNDYGYGRVDIEICCENNFQNPYNKFYVSCVAIRADYEILCKINHCSTPRLLVESNHTKITKEGKMAFGVSYHFRSTIERTLLLDCHSFCIEGYVAFKKKNNGYGFMCRVEQSNGQWFMVDGNTNRTFKKRNIESLSH